MSSNRDNNKSPRPKSPTRPICFVIMPVSDPPGYDKGHFEHVFEDLFVPACHEAGYEPLRADQVLATNLIHLDVLQRIIDSPMVLCDLSDRNPNVLFELGLRQAFDKPVALVQQVGTPPIFDIAPLRYTNYGPELIYRQVLEDQKEIAAALTATAEAATDKNSVNSIVKLLGLTHPASRADTADVDKNSAMLQIVIAELANLRSEIRSNRPSTRPDLGVEAVKRHLIADLILKSPLLKEIRGDLERTSFIVDQLVHDTIPPTDLTQEFQNIQYRLNNAFDLANDPFESRAITILEEELVKLRLQHDQYVRAAKKDLKN